MSVHRGIVLLSIMLAWASPAWAVGTQYNGTCASISWTANTETDLAGYRLYDRVSLSAAPTLIKNYGVQTTSATCASLAFNAGQHYLSLSALDLNGNQSILSTEQPFVIVSNNQIDDLRVTATTTTSLTVALTEVEDGTGAPANYDVRVATPTIVWGTALSVTSGTCTTPVTGTTVGATKSCTITGLTNATQYQVQAIPYRGTIGSSAIYGPLSNVATGTTGALSQGNRTTLIRDDFTRADAGNLGADWDNSFSQPFAIVSNRVQPPSGGPIVSNQTHTGELPSDQWAEVVLTTIAGASNLYEGVKIRASYGLSTSYYSLYAARGAFAGTYIDVYIEGVQSVVVNESATVWANGDVFRGEAIGSSLCIYRNDVQVICGTDTSLTSGHAGMKINLTGGVATNAQMDNFRAGSFDRTTLISDEFTRGNSTGLQNQWEIIESSPWTVTGNLVQPPSAGPVLAIEVHPTPLPSRQWAQVTLSAISGASEIYLGLSLVSSRTASTSYQFMAVKGGSFPGSSISYRENGVFVRNVAVDPATVWVAGDILRAEHDADGTMRLYRNGILLLTGEDTALSGGVVGLRGYLNTGAATTMQLDSFSAGGFTGSSSDLCGCDNH